jgi:hypothetical protein
VVGGVVHPHPGRGRAGAREQRAKGHHCIELELRAAHALGLVDAKQLRVVEVADRLVGQPAQLFALRGPLSQHREQGFGLLPQNIMRESHYFKPENQS